MMARAKRAAIVLSLVAVAAANTAAAAPSPTPSATATSNVSRDDVRAADLLRAAMNAEKTVSYVAQVQTIRFGANGSDATIVKEEHLAPDQTHKVYLAPESLYGDSVIVRSDDTMTYDAKRLRVVASHGQPYGESVANGNLGLLLANYRPVLSGTKIVAGRATIPCALINRFTGELVMRLWIDADTRLILQRETYHANGTVGSRVQFEDIRYTAAIPPAVFATPLPRGYTLVQNDEPGAASTDVSRVLAQAGFNPAGPHYLPEGFTLMSADVATLKGIKTLHLLYSDGIRSLSLFESASNAPPDYGRLQPLATKIGNRDATYVNQGTTTLLSWKEKGLVFALVGDLDVKDLKAIAGSVS
ncbi:MAG: sigma-E factor regulatory protein RseB domain-containing protein [Vulcanimicrobiaceae bacterium]